jgi:hypothetical protein
MNTVDCDAGWLGAARALQEYGDEWLQEVLPGADVNTLYEWMQALGSLHPRISPRIMLQHLGTEWGRQVADQDIWVNCMLRNAALVINGASYDRCSGVVREKAIVEKINGEARSGVVVSDVRFANELQAIKNADGKLIRVRRKAADGNALKTGIKGHASEAEQQGFKDTAFNVIIHNNKSMEELLKNVDKIVRVL